jgi:peptidyl-dipeptidase Dcp
LVGSADADGFDAFEEAGDIFAPQPAKRFYDFVYSAVLLRDRTSHHASASRPSCT